MCRYPSKFYLVGYSCKLGANLALLVDFVLIIVEFIALISDWLLPLIIIVLSSISWFNMKAAAFSIENTFFTVWKTSSQALPVLEAGCSSSFIFTCQHYYIPAHRARSASHTHSAFLYSLPFWQRAERHWTGLRALATCQHPKITIYRLIIRNSIAYILLKFFGPISYFVGNGRWVFGELGHNTRPKFGPLGWPLGTLFKIFRPGGDRESQFVDDQNRV